MVSEACCNSDQTQAVFPEPVIPATREVKGARSETADISVKTLELLEMG